MSILKIPIESDSGLQPLLINWDQGLPITAMIKDICIQWNLPDPNLHALKFKSLIPSFYLTEENRNELKPGVVLQIAPSPSSCANNIIKVLKQESRINESLISTLKELSTLIRDSSFTSEFVIFNGIQILFSMLLTILAKNEISDNPVILLLLDCIQDIFENSMIPTDAFNSEIIQQIMAFLVKCNKSYIQSKILSLLEIAIYNYDFIIPIVMQNLSFDSLMLLISDDDINIQLSSLSFINSLLNRGDSSNISKLLKSKKFYQHIGARLINAQSHVRPSTAHQLYLCQNLSLSVLEKRALVTFNSDYQEHNDLLDYLISSLRSHNPDNPAKPSKSEFTKLGFLNIDPIIDFNEIPPGLLALDCMVYFAKSQPDNFSRHVLRLREYQCPFVQTSIALTRIMYSLLKIGEPLSDISTEYFTMFFSHEFFFEEFFCINIQLLYKTWKEMKATHIDFEKVLSVCHKQIATVIREEDVSTLDSYRKKIMQLNYAQILKQLDIEKEHHDANISKAKPVIELKDRLKPHILQLIHEQRLNQMVKGETFTSKRSRKPNIYLKLSQNHKYLHFGDPDASLNPSIENLPNKIQISQIRDVVFSLKERSDRGRIRKENYPFSILYSSEGEEKRLELLANDNKIFSIWNDGFKILLGHTADSDIVHDDIETLLNMDMKLHLLAIENIAIPDYPPAIPSDPPNFDFILSS